MNGFVASLAKLMVCAVAILVTANLSFAQGKGKARAGSAAPNKASAKAARKVTVIDIEGLRKVLKPGSKPLMINFWATWCDPCREEFPDLVKIDTLYKGKIDFITVTLDTPDEATAAVPKFLSLMKATMPTYLLHTPDEDAAISLVTPDWAGNLPLTIIYKPTGETAYLKKGKVHIDDVSLAIDKLLTTRPAGQ
jgi:thiol-disulfide isomerase/thioredoxin